MTKILVTGTSGGGIGEHIVRSLLRDKTVEVIGVERRVADYGDRYTHVQGDLTSTETIEKVKQAVGDKLDGVVFNAAVLCDVSSIAKIDVNMIKLVFEVNFFSVISLTQAILPALRAGNGRAIYVSSYATEKPMRGWTAYGASKIALNIFVQTLALEEPGITALAIEPGDVDTPMQASVREVHIARGVMSEAETKRFTDLKKDGLLVDPVDSGNAFANLVLLAHNEWSGKYFPWNDPLFNSLTTIN